MKASHLIESIKLLLEYNLVPYVQGQPGLGKSSVFKQVAEDLGVEIIDFRPALHGVEDLIGLPNFSSDKLFSSFATPNWLPKSGKGIFFIDELPQAMPGMMAALSQFILDRKIGNYTLPKGWMIASAGNRTSDRAATHKRPSHINDRLVILDMEFSSVDFDEFCRVNDVPTVVRAFAKFNPKALQSFDASLEINCTPRSMIMAGKLIDAPAHLMHELLTGTIGEGVAAEFRGYMKIWNELPDLDLILKSPTSVAVSDKPDIQYGVSTLLSANASVENFGKMLQYMSRMPGEFTAAFVKDALRTDPEILDTPELESYLKVNASILV